MGRRGAHSPLVRWLVLPLFLLAVSLMPVAAGVQDMHTEAAMTGAMQGAGMDACPDCDAAGDRCLQSCALCHVIAPVVAGTVQPDLQRLQLSPVAGHGKTGPRPEVPSPPPRVS